MLTEWADAPAAMFHAFRWCWSWRGYEDSLYTLCRGSTTNVRRSGTEQCQAALGQEQKADVNAHVHKMTYFLFANFNLGCCRAAFWRGRLTASMLLAKPGCKQGDFWRGMKGVLSPGSRADGTRQSSWPC